MIRALWFLIKVCVFVGAVVWLTGQPGRVQMTWQGYAIDTSVGFVIGVFAVFMTVYTLMYRLWRATIALPQAIRRYRATRQREKGYRDVTSGFLAIAAGDAETAGRYSGRALKALPDAPLAKLLSAQSLLIRGDAVKARRAYLDLLDDETSAFFGVRGLLQEALHIRDYGGALTYARRAAELQPKRAWVLRTLFDLETRGKEWGSAMTVLKKAGRFGVFNEATITRYRAALWLAQAEDCEQRGKIPGAVRLAGKAVSTQDSFSPAVVFLARMLFDQGKTKAALKIIAKAWAVQPHPSLGDLWMEHAPPDRKKISPYAREKGVFAWAEKLCAAYPDHHESQKLLGRVALDTHEWNTARGCFLKTGDFRSLAQLELDETGDTKKAQAWMLRAVEEQSGFEPCWSCEACGHTALSWRPLCAACGAFGTAEWVIAPPPIRQGITQATAILGPAVFEGDVVSVTASMRQ